MFWKKQTNEFDYDNYVTYTLNCRNLEYCERVLDSMSKKYRGGVFVHKPIKTNDFRIKKIDYIIDVANNKKIREDVEEELKPAISKMQVI
jgi:hypothetical protein